MLHELHDSIAKLSNNYSIRSGLYKITYTEEEKLRKESTLIRLVNRINEYIVNCPTDRIEQRDVFAKLVKEYGTHSDARTASYILLGALFYRYFRLLDSYENKIIAPPSTLFGFFSALSAINISSLDNCRLFMAIRKVLLPHGPKFSLENDYKLLDGATVVQALQCFKANMEKTKREKKESFFYPDPEFLVKLDKLIADQSKRGEDILKQISAITFLTSLSTLLVKENRLFQQELDSYLTSSDCGEMLLFENMHALPLSEQAKSNITILLDFDKNKDEADKSFSTMSRLDFIKKIKEMHLERMQCILMGALILLLKSPHVDNDLKSCINEILITDMNNTNNLLICVGLLQQYSVLASDARDEVAPLDFNVDFFGHDEAFKTTVVQCYDALKSSEIINEEEERPGTLTNN